MEPASHEVDASLEEEPQSSPIPNGTALEAGGKREGNAHSPRDISTISWVILCTSLLLAETQAALDSTITANLQPTIINDLGEISKFPWISVTYNLANGGTCLLWGKLFRAFDNKEVLLIARLFFAIGSALTAAAPTMNALIVGKAITGIGGSGTYIGVIKIITSLTSLKEHGRYFGYIGFCWGFGTIIGPVIGGGFAATSGWRWSFYFNLILVAVTLPAFMFILRSSKGDSARSRPWVRLRSIDLLGALLFAGALCSGVMAMSFGGALYPWSSGRIIGLFCCSGALWSLFGLQQAATIFTSKHDRILPAHILLSIEMWILILQIAAPISILFMTIYYIPLFFQFVQGETALQTAVDLLPFLITTVILMLVSGRLLGGYYKLWFIAGSGLALVMSVCLYNTSIDTSRGKIYGYLVLGGVGTGLYAMNSGPVMAAIVPPEDATHASTLFGCVDTVCGAISVAVANSIFLNRATDGIQHVLPQVPRSSVQNAIAGVGAPITEGLSSAQRQAVLQAILDAIRDVWIQMIATAALSFILAMLMRNEKMRH